jgi:hypothetical protein
MLNDKQIFKWIKADLHGLYQVSGRKLFPSIEAMVDDIIKKHPNYKPHIDYYFARKGLHVGHYKEVSQIKDIIFDRTDDYFCRFCKKIHDPSFDSYREHKISKGYIPVVIFGDTGTGKTTFVELLSQQEGFKLVKINSSGEIKKTDFPTSRLSIFSEKLMILFDEADRWTKANYTNVQGVLGNLPILFTCNYVKKFKFDSDVVKRVEFGHLDSDAIFQVIKTLSKVNDTRASELALSCKGDIRQAVNVKEEGDLVVKDEPTPFNLAKSVLSDPTPEVFDTLEGSNESLDFVIRILSENNTGSFPERYQFNETLQIAQKYKYIVPRTIINSMLATLPKSKTRNLKFPKWRNPV